jgi:methionyl-tRNA formyltransferase
MSQPLRIAFMGSPGIALGVLEALIAAGHEIACVYSQPPRPAGRGQKLTPTAVHAFAEARGLEVRTPKSLKKAEEQAAFAALGLDAAVVVAYGLILPQPILDAPRLGCLNMHGGRHGNRRRCNDDGGGPRYRACDRFRPYTDHPRGYRRHTA